MAGYALFIQHRTKPGRRNDVEAVWRKHMKPTIAANEKHVAYFYCFGDDPDSICAFQQYPEREAAAAFVRTRNTQPITTAPPRRTEHRRAGCPVVETGRLMMNAPADQGSSSQRSCGCSGAGGDGDQEQQLAMPPVVSIDEWSRARQQLLAKEKEATRLLDRLAAERRRLPMTRVAKSYRFEGPDGFRSIVDLFEGRRQLIVYHFMYAPDWDAPCPGCCRRMDDVGHLAHLNARDTTFAVVARSPYERLASLWSRKGWTMPVWSHGDSNFNADMGIMGDNDFGISVFFRDDSGGVYRSYFTDGRGVEPAGFRALLDMTPYGRQEDWEDSPQGWPQSPTHGWGSERDGYEY